MRLEAEVIEVVEDVEVLTGEVPSITSTSLTTSITFRRMPLVITSRDTGVRFNVHVQPRASRNEIAGERDGALRVRLTAPPVDNAANEALVELLAKALRTARRDIRIVGGARSRRKVVEIDGITADQVKTLAP